MKASRVMHVVLDGRDAHSLVTDSARRSELVIRYVITLLDHSLLLPSSRPSHGLAARTTAGRTALATSLPAAISVSITSLFVSYTEMPTFMLDYKILSSF